MFESVSKQFGFFILDAKTDMNIRGLVQQSCLFFMVGV